MMQIMSYVWDVKMEVKVECDVDNQEGVCKSIMVFSTYP